ncbi:MAG: hypothetical protein R6W94_04220 [Spirochaetia bacterium]
MSTARTTIGAIMVSVVLLGASSALQSIVQLPLAPLQLVPRLPGRHRERFHAYPRTTFAAFDLLKKRVARRGRATDTDTG